MTMTTPTQPPTLPGRPETSSRDTGTAPARPKPHPLAEWFPLMAEAELAELAADIRANGLREPIVLHEGRVLDGRNRLAACDRAGVNPRFREFDGDDPLAFVVSVNVHRRHLNIGQKAMLAAKVYHHEAERARARQAAAAAQTNATRWGSSLPATVPEATATTATPAPPTPAPAPRLGSAFSRSASASQPAPTATPATTATRATTGTPAPLTPAPTATPATTATRAPSPDAGEAREKVAALTGVSPRTVSHALTVQSQGAPELVAAVVREGMPVSTAATLAALPATEQAEVVAKGRDEILAAAKRIKDEQRAARQEKQRAAAVTAAQAAPDVEGVDLRLGAVAEVVATLEGAALVHADPPWTYSNTLKDNGAAEAHYQTRSMEDIVEDVGAAYGAAGADAYLLLWMTGPLLAEWFVATSTLPFPWTYKSVGVWAKTGRIGVGFHWRGDAEHLLLYVKGNPRPFADATSNLHVAERTAHSEKPAEWLRTLVRTFTPPGALVVDLYAGLAPLARACRAEDRRYVGAEIDPARRAEALLRLHASEETP